MKCPPALLVALALGACSPVTVSGVGLPSSTLAASVDGCGLLAVWASDRTVIALRSGSSGGYVSAAALQPNGKVVVAGFTYTDSSSDFALARYGADGSLDTSFDGDGEVTTGFGTSATGAKAVAVQPGRNIVVAGGTSAASSSDSSGR